MQFNIEIFLSWKALAPRSHIKPDVQKAVFKLIYILFAYILFVNKIIYKWLHYILKTKFTNGTDFFKNK